jgi:hypothetical protein
MGLGARLLLCALLGLAWAAAQAPAANADVVLNEINCEATDWVEIVNTSDTPADISGWLLTDDPLGSVRTDHRMHFANPTTIPAHGVLVVEKGASGFPFGISCGNDTIRLADATETLVDEIAVPTLVSSVDTWGRYPNGTGSWVETISTKGAPNQPSSASGGGGDLAGWMFDPNVVVDIDLSLPQSSIDALNADPETYQDGTFSLTTTGGTYGPLQVGIRLKGKAGSFRPLTGKSAFKVKFNHSVAGQRFLGLKKLTLNNMVQDPSMIHEALTYEAFRSAGVPAPRTGYANVHLNGDDYGLYLNLETLDEVALARWFSSTKHVYEGEYGEDVTTGGAGAFQVDEGSEADLSDLEALIDAVNNPSGDWSDNVSAVANLQEMTRMWAVEKYVGNWDGYAGGVDDPFHPNNYYLQDENSGVFRLLPWGTDQTWDRRIAFDGRGAGLMFDRCLDDASCYAMYRDAVRDVRTLIIGLNLDGRAQTLAAQLAPWQATDPRREYSLGQIADGVRDTRAFLAVRPDDAAAWLDPPPPPPPPPTNAPPTNDASGAGSVLAASVASQPAKKSRCKQPKRARGASAARNCKRKRR